jgi:hypothetical protein
MKANAEIAKQQRKQLKVFKTQLKADGEPNFLKLVKDLDLSVTRIRRSVTKAVEAKLKVSPKGSEKLIEVYAALVKCHKHGEESKEMPEEDLSALVDGKVPD